MLLYAAIVLLAIPTILAAPSPQLTGEIRSYHQVGDKIKGEYSRLHPDGSVTKTWAFGDTKNGLQYKTFQMDPQGNVRSITPQNQQQLNQQNQPTQQLNQQTQQLNQQTQQLNQPTQQQQISSQTPNTQTTGSVPPGVNWFLQQPLMSPIAGVNPFPDPFAAADPQNPAIQDPLLNPFINNPFAPASAPANPLLGTNNPLWNWFNF